ncbi:MAG: hypothetical protein NZM09_01330 [Ignavibacterium sp.]|nr:hypothetical protein [Ignavibacterium sp.]MDW8374314.1 hypothetical protein [Ignavibacteriales bacterium]
MDSLFDIIIFLIIIISFLSSLFQKKEKPKTTQKTEGSTQTKSSDGFSEFESEKIEVEAPSYDILSEIEKIFNEDLGVPKQKREPEFQTPSTIPERSLETESISYDKFDLEKKVALETQAKFQRKEIAIDSKTETAAKMFEELLKKQGAKKKEKHPIIKKIRDPQLIKDYIIVSEILNKPLALRK